MREEKKSEIILDALNFLDDEMIEEVDALRGGFITTEETMAEETVTEIVEQINWKRTKGRYTISQMR